MGSVIQDLTMKRHFVLIVLYIIFEIHGNDAEFKHPHMHLKKLFKRQIHRNLMQYQGPYTMQRINDPYLGNVDIQTIDVYQYENPVVPYRRPNVVPVNMNVYPQKYNGGGNQYEVKVLEVDEQGNVYQENPNTGGSQYIGNIYQQNQQNNPNSIRPNNNPTPNMKPEVVNPTNMNNNADNYPQKQTPTPSTNIPNTGINSQNYPSLDELISKSNSLIHVPPKNQQKQQEEIPSNIDKNPPVQQNGDSQTEKSPVDLNTEAPYIFGSINQESGNHEDEKPKTSVPRESLDVLKNREDVLQHTPTFGIADSVVSRQGAGTSEVSLNTGAIRK